MALPVIDLDKIVTKPVPGSYQIIQNENAMVPNNGLKNDYTVNFALVNRKEFRDKFDNFATNKNVEQSLYIESTKMLSHRSGTEYEDIAMLDARTGELIVKDVSADGENKFKSGLNKKEKEILQSANVDFEILHNHPGSSQPSRADIIGLFDRPRAVASTVIGHDGTLYRMEKLKPYDDIVNLSNSIYNKAKERYSFESANLIENHAAENLLNFLIAGGYLRYIKR